MKDKRVIPGWLSRWLPALLWMAIIFALSHQPKNDIPSFGTWDLLVKGSHLLAYALLFLLLRRALRADSLALIAALLFAFSDEYHQSFIAGRNGQLSDVIIDFLGVLLAWGAVTIWTRWKKITPADSSRLTPE